MFAVVWFYAFMMAWLSVVYWLGPGIERNNHWERNTLPTILKLMAKFELAIDPVEKKKRGRCILRSVTVGSAEQNGRDAERAVAFLTA